MAEGSDPVRNIVALGSEALVPGGSHWVKGDIPSGLLHTVAGLLATAVWGLPGRALVSASSYSKATTGKRLFEHVLGQIGNNSGTTPPPPAG
ncbi:MAG TPA: DUF6072 family protein [Acidimicrobiales bacterium]|nr:DUF6072 family protein [Acidimicrobiales bacterium]